MNETFFRYFSVLLIFHIISGASIYAQTSNGEIGPLKPLSERPVVIHSVTPDYPTYVKNKGVEGIVILKLLIETQGHVSRVEILKPSHPHLNQAAANAAYQFKFRPGNLKDVDVKVWMRIPFSFVFKGGELQNVKNKSRKIEKEAKSYVNDNKQEKAIEYYEKLIKIFSSFKNECSYRGYEYKLKQKYEKAEAYKWKSVAIDWDFANAYAAAAQLYKEMNQYNMSIDAYRKAIELHPDSYNFYGNLGWIYYLNGDFSKCIEFSEKCIQLNPGVLFAKFNIALSYLHQGKFGASKYLYFQAIIYAREKKLEINKGAMKNLKNLIDQDLYADYAQQFLREIFLLSESEIDDL